MTASMDRRSPILDELEGREQLTAEAGVSDAEKHSAAVLMGAK
jgi:hypothetical protein